MDTPNAFSFTNVTGANTKKFYTSNVITVAGINSAASVTISGTNCRWNKNGGEFTASSGTVVSGDNVAIQGFSSSTNSATNSGCTLTIGGVNNSSAPWTITTRSRKSISPLIRKEVDYERNYSRK